MELLFQFILLGLGLVFLWKMGEMSVRNALGFSSIYGIHQFSIGFLIFAISTGLPEISSAIISSLNNVPELSVGDLMGSTFVNISLVLGVVAIIAKAIEVPPYLKKKLFKAMGLMALILIWLTIQHGNHLFNGILLIAIYLASIYWFQGGLPKEETSQEIEIIEKEVEKTEKKGVLPPKIDILIKLFGSLCLLLLSSWITVHAAVKISTLMGINLSLVGGTLIAVGTSFPELVLEIHAIKKKEYALALGDLFGSSLLNISFILGFLLLMNRKVQLSYIWTILPFMTAIFIWATWALIRKQQFTRKDGYFFLGAFLVYLGWNAYSHFSVVY